MGQQIFVALVRLLGVSHAGILPHGPQTSAVHRGLHSAGKGIFAGIPYFMLVVRALNVGRRIKRLHRNVRGGFEAGSRVSRGARLRRRSLLTRNPRF